MGRGEEDYFVGFGIYRGYILSRELAVYNIRHPRHKACEMVAAPSD
jgi:hypothetical protein